MFEVGQKVKVVDYPAADEPEKIVGQVGTVLGQDWLYVDVQFDKPVEGLEVWLFVPNELEAVDA